MAQEAQDEGCRHAELRRCVHAGAVQAFHHHDRIQAVAGVRLGVEEQLGVGDVVLLGALQVGAGHVIKVLLGLEHQRTCMVDVQKALQVVKDIGLAHGLRAGVGQRHAVALGQGKHLFGLQRAFDMHVQLGLGHGAQEFGHALRGYGFDEAYWAHGITPKVMDCWLKKRR